MIRKIVIGIVITAVFSAIAVSAPADDYGRMDQNLVRMLADSAPGDYLPVVVLMKDRPDKERLASMVKGLPRAERKRLVWKEVSALAEESQRDLLELVRAEADNGRVKFYRSLKISNGVGLEATADFILELVDREDVYRIIGTPPRPVIYEPINPQPDNGELDEIVWGVEQINAPAVWDEGYTGDGVLVAMIDSGVDYNHPDLADHLWDGGDEYPNHGWDFGDNDDDPMDTEEAWGHGTHTAGTVAGDGTSGSQTGVAPDATIMCLKVGLYANEAGETAIWAAQDFALEHEADITSLSMGWEQDWGPDRETWRNQYDILDLAGIVNVVAAGNERVIAPPNSCRTPGDVPSPWRHPDEVEDGGRSGVISVGATNSSDIYANFSSRGPVTWQNVNGYNDYPWDGATHFGLLRPDVSAPGVNIKSLDLGGGYTLMDGTSMATPHVAGTVALMLEKSPELTTIEIDSVLQVSSVDLGSEGKDNDYGSGRIDAYEAVMAAPAVVGVLEGVVTNANTNGGLEGVIVDLLESDMADTTDETGAYSMELLRGQYTIVVDNAPFQVFISEGVQIDSAETTYVDIPLTVGIFDVNPDSLNVILGDDDPVDRILTITNPGTAPMEVDLEMEPVFEVDDSMDIVGEFNPTGITGDSWINGMTYYNGVFYISGSNNWSNPNYIYRFDFDGNFLGSTEQPGSNLPGANTQGMRDLACDGTYLYGGILDQVIAMDMTSGHEAYRFTGPFNNNTAMAYDPDRDVLWISKNSQDIVAVDKVTGEEQDRIPASLYIDAITYWPGEEDGYNLYLAAHALNENLRGVYRANPETHEIEWVMDLPDVENQNYKLKGLAIIQRYNVYYNAIASLMTTSDLGGIIIVRELNMAIPYATFSPDNFVVFPENERDVTISFSSSGLENGNYRARLVARHNTLEELTIIPILLTLDLNAVPSAANDSSLPLEFALGQPYPNPFNSNCTIRFELPRESVVRLAVYDILGREVAVLKDKSYPAGKYEVNFNGSGLASGLYFVRFEGGSSFVKTAKMVLLK